MAKKKVAAIVKIQIEAGKASPAPPVGDPPLAVLVVSLNVARIKVQVIDRVEGDRPFDLGLVHGGS